MFNPYLRTKPELAPYPPNFHITLMTGLGESRQRLRSQTCGWRIMSSSSSTTKNPPFDSVADSFDILAIKTLQQFIETPAADEQADRGQN
ncbi:hypothetical protein TNCV_1347121 [Trichonephila clavipes]|nr:hypothetical protein TNCV_1347121 [Trichonephila clavipes]